jgi:hypothetical protein
MDLRELSPRMRLWFPFMALDGPPRPHGRSGLGHRPGPRRRRLWKRLGIITGSVLAAFVLAACSSASSSHPSPSKPSLSVPSVGALSPGAVPTPSTSSADGPLACVTAGKPAAGSGPWKLVPPGTLCGLPEQTSAQDQQSGQSLASIDKILFNMDNVGPVTSTIAAMYQGARAASFRSVSVVGFDGSFRPAAALSALEEPGSTYTDVPPGPHGGRLACANVEGSEDCVWATPTTACEITIIDPTGELMGANSGTNAVRIRDVLEVPG